MTAYQEWVGRTRSLGDVIGVFSARAMGAVLDRPGDRLVGGASLPPGWHWLYFNEAARSSDLGRDGHERRGDFLPPVPLPRRMWAGGRLEFGEPLRLGDEASRRSTILAVREKEGRSGTLVFVTVQHEVWGPRGLAVLEEQDLVYRDHLNADPPAGSGASGPTAGSEASASAESSLSASAAPGPREPAVPDARTIAIFATDPVTLFRFSALTFNGHRIHYDHPYTTKVENYPGLVVHGPLLALLLLDAAAAEADRQERGGAIAKFSYRAVGPAFCGEEIALLGREGAETTGKTGETMDLWAATSERGIAMTATAAWRQ